MEREALIDRMKEFFITQPIEKVWLFGSFSRGEETAKSDIDLIVRFIEGVRIGLQYFKIKSSLESILERGIDLAEEGTIDSAVESAVNQEKILIYERAS